MLLVIDVTKRIQTQTAECLILGELLTDKLIVVLNKTDLLGKIKTKNNENEKKVSKVLVKTKFEDSPFCCVYACKGGGDVGVNAAAKSEFKSDLSELKNELLPKLEIPNRLTTINNPLP
eukprot:UN18246